jgi:hypothetical protein
VSFVVAESAFFPLDRPLIVLEMLYIQISFFFGFLRGNVLVEIVDSSFSRSSESESNELVELAGGFLAKFASECMSS